MRLGPNPNADMNQQFESVLNVAFAYAGNQAFVTVMCEMRNPSKDYTPAIIWLNAIAVPLYVIIGCIIYWLSGQYVVAPALGSAPGVASQVAYGILIPTMLGSGLVFGHTAIKYMYNVVMDSIIKSPRKLTENTFTTWGVWLGCGTLFWVVAFGQFQSAYISSLKPVLTISQYVLPCSFLPAPFGALKSRDRNLSLSHIVPCSSMTDKTFEQIFANAIPAFNSILGISSALFVTW